MRRLALLLLASAVSAATFSDREEAALLAADSALGSAVARLVGVSLEKEKVPYIRAELDRAAAEAATGLGWAVSLSSRSVESCEEISSALKAGGGVDKRDEEAAAPVAAERGRWTRLSRQAEELKSRVPSGDEESERRRREAADFLDEADRALRRAEDELRELADWRGRLRESQRRAESTREEIRRAVQETASAASAVRLAAAEAAPAVDALGAEPQTRTRAGLRLDAVLQAGRSFHAAADRVFNRATEARRWDRAYRDALSHREDLGALAAKETAGSRVKLSQAEDALARMKLR